MFELRVILAGSLTVCFAAIAQPAEAREPTVLAPSSNWNLDYAADKCRLIRRFGEGEDLIELHFEQATQRPYYNVALFGKPVDKTRGEVMEVSFGPAEGSSVRSYLKGDLPSKTPFILMHGVHLAPVPEDAKQGEFVVVDIGAEREKAIEQLTLSKGLRRSLKLELGSMHEPLEAMRACVSNLINELKLDEEGQAELVSGPTPTNMQRIARYIQEIYPARMLREEQGGTVNVQLIVDKQGAPTVCQIAQSDRPAAFDDLVCLGLLQIAEFNPAKGPNGEARYGLYTTKVTYRIR